MVENPPLLSWWERQVNLSRAAPVPRVWPVCSQKQVNHSRVAPDNWIRQRVAGKSQQADQYSLSLHLSVNTKLKCTGTRQRKGLANSLGPDWFFKVTNTHKHIDRDTDIRNCLLKVVPLSFIWTSSLVGLKRDVHADRLFPPRLMGNGVEWPCPLPHITLWEKVMGEMKLSVKPYCILLMPSSPQKHRPLTTVCVDVGGHPSFYLQTERWTVVPPTPNLITGSDSSHGTERHEQWSLLTLPPMRNYRPGFRSNPTPLEMEFPLINVPSFTNSQIPLKLNVIPHNTRPQ